MLCYSQGFPLPPEFHHVLVLHKQLSCLEKSSLLISPLRLTTQPPQTFYNYILGNSFDSQLIYSVVHPPALPLLFPKESISSSITTPVFYNPLKEELYYTIYIYNVYLCSTEIKQVNVLKALRFLHKITSLDSVLCI